MPAMEGLVLDTSIGVKLDQPPKKRKSP